MLGKLLQPEYEKYIKRKDWAGLRGVFAELHPADIAEVLEDLPAENSGVIFRLLPRATAATVFEYLPVDQQREIVSALGTEQLVNLLNEMAPDDRTRLFEELPAEVTKLALAILRSDELKVARQLLGYPEKSAGRYMTPEYLALRRVMTAAEALSYVREHGRASETLNVVYVTDERGVLLAEVKLANLVLAAPEAKIAELVEKETVSIPATAPREEVVTAFEKYDRVAVPVTDSQGILVGIITVDDVLDVAEQEATEDIQRLGGVQALEAPYLGISFFELVRKRGVWLAVLFLGEMLTATAMGYYEQEIQRAVVLALFIPLIISSGGNSGSQATSLIIRALALRELTLSDWWRVLWREVRSGLALGALLGTIGLVRIVISPWREQIYGPHYVQLGATIAIALVGVVLFGTVVGSMLPFVLRRIGLDPATASAPLVATLVDVSGLVIYFTAASLMLKGLLL